MRCELLGPFHFTIRMGQNGKPASPMMQPDIELTAAILGALAFSITATQD